jgi:hypothetical protein
MRFFGGGVKTPKVSAATATTPIQRAPTPSAAQQELEQKDADIRRQRLLAKGRTGTILTEKTNIEDTGKASLLGRTT